MKPDFTCIILILLGTALCLSCQNDRTTVEQGRDQTRNSFQPISYRRTGGIVGTDDRITIAADGSVQTQGRLVGFSKGKLTELQMMQLSRLFEDWDKFKDEYPPPKQAADAFLIEIKYGGKTVKASEAAPDLPESFTRISQRLESIARDLPASP